MFELAIYFKGDTRGGKSSLAKELHKNPTQKDIWQDLAKYIETYLPSQSSVAYKSCGIAERLGHNVNKVSFSLSQ